MYFLYDILELLGFLFFIIPIAIIILWVRTSRLARKVSELEFLVAGKRTDGKDGPLTSASTSVPSAVNATQAPSLPVAEETKTSTLAAADKDKFSFTGWLREDWLVKLGALLLLIGLGWFVSYAFVNNWVGPQGRITLGILAGLVFYILGDWRMRHERHQGGIFLILGSTMLLITFFSARFLYDFFTPASALLLMFVSVAFVALESVRYRSERLAVASVLLAGVAPLLTHNASPSFAGLSWYLLVAVLATVWIVSFRGWRSPLFASFVVVALYHVPILIHGGPSKGDSGLALTFAFVFATIFLLSSATAFIRNIKEKFVSDVYIALGSALLLIWWIYAVPTGTWNSLILSAWGLVYAISGFLTFRVTRVLTPFFIYGSMSVLFLASATAAELSGPMLTIAFTIEAALVPVLVYAVLKDVRPARFSALFLAIPIFLSLSSIVSPLWNSRVLHADFAVLLVLVVSLLVLGLFFLRLRSPSDGRVSLSLVSLLIASTYSLLLVWLVTHAIFIEDVATTLSLIIYAIVGVLSYLFGRARDGVALRYVGATLLLIVTGRLLFVEVWKMSLGLRIVVFFVIGIFFIITAFLGRSPKKESNNHIPE